MSRRMMTLKGVFPDPKPVRRKNFIHENIMSLRQMKQYYTNKNLEDLKNLHIDKRPKIKTFNNSVSGIQSNVTKSKTLSIPSSDKIEKPLLSSQDVTTVYRKTPVFTKKSSTIPVNRKCPSSQDKSERIQTKKKTAIPDNKIKRTIDSSPARRSGEVGVQLKSQGIQTLDCEKLDDIYAEGTILFATKKIVDKSLESGDDKRMQNEQSKDRGDMYEVQLEGVPDKVNITKSNKQHNTLASRIVNKLANGIPPPSYRKGVVPKYIQERKETLKKEQKAKAVGGFSDCPEGHIPIPDQERKETLRMLKNNYQECINKLNHLPIKSDTLRAQRQKMEIEKQLCTLEEGIKVFSRPKVFIKMDA